MGHSVLVFVSHSSTDKEDYIEPIVRDLEDCYINVWIDKRKILPGDNLRKSIFRDGLDKADIALLFFTAESLKSSWVDKEIKHVLREESKKGNNFDLNKIISIFDSKETYAQISERYPELTDDLLHLMPKGYGKTEFGQLVSAIWSKYLSLQGGDVETQKQLFQKDKIINDLTQKINEEKNKNKSNNLDDDFENIYNSEKVKNFIFAERLILTDPNINPNDVPDCSMAVAFGLLEESKINKYNFVISEKGKKFFQWYFFNKA